MERNHLRIGHSYSVSGGLEKFFKKKNFILFQRPKIQNLTGILAKKKNNTILLFRKRTKEQKN
jgi:hypothetical protein